MCYLDDGIIPVSPRAFSYQEPCTHEGIHQVTRFGIGIPGRAALAAAHGRVGLIDADQAGKDALDSGGTPFAEEGQCGIRAPCDGATQAAEVLAAVGLKVQSSAGFAAIIEFAQRKGHQRQAARIALGVGGHGRRERGIQNPRMGQVHFSDGAADHALKREAVGRAKQECAANALGDALERGMGEAMVKEVGAQGSQHLKARGSPDGLVLEPSIRLSRKALPSCF